MMPKSCSRCGWISYAVAAKKRCPKCYYQEHWLDQLAPIIVAFGIGVLFALIFTLFWNQ